MDHEPCIGVLGGGQLGRMLALEARRMGYRTVQWTGGEQSGAERLADHAIIEPFDSETALEQFTQMADVVTVEFENIPSDLVAKIAKTIPLMPAPSAVSICQNREKEKLFLRSHHIPTTAFAIVHDSNALKAALEDIPGDVILKTLTDGYDGKGQLLIKDHSDRPSPAEIWEEFGCKPAIVEKRINLAAELSVMCARSTHGDVATYDPAENQHLNHILDISIIPARLPEAQLTQAREIAQKVTEQLNYIGVLGVEFFVDQSGALLVNEIAPRPHNSGHHTLDACATSQFEQQLRAICGLPLGSTQLIQPAVMLNLLGDIWKSPTTAPDWTSIHQTPGAKLHLYGKSHAKPGRKMGHVTFTADTIEKALSQANHCKKIYGIASV